MSDEVDDHLARTKSPILALLQWGTDNLPPPQQNVLGCLMLVIIKHITTAQDKVAALRANGEEELAQLQEVRS